MQVSHIVSYLDRFSKQRIVYGIFVVSWELFDDDKDTFNQFTRVFIYLKAFYHNMLKNWIQSTSHKVQNSISHTPEGTDTERVILSGDHRGTSIKAHAASVSSIDLCTTPVVIGGE